MELSKVYRARVSDTELHEYCDLHPTMDEHQFKGLVHSLLIDGQMQPIIMYRGKCVDGRHRLWALAECGIDTVNYVDIPQNTRLIEVRAFVMNTEKRRHQTKNQMICAAYMDFINPKTEAKTLSALAVDYGISQAGISQAKKVTEEFGIKVIKSFLIGEKLNLTVNGTSTNYSTIGSLYSAMKRTKVESWARAQRKVAVGFNEGNERNKIRIACLNDSVDLLKFKQSEILDLIVMAEHRLRKQEEEFNNE